MKKKTHQTKITILLIIVMFFSSCSTKKKYWTNRQYHNITAKYNGYFNGKESFKLGVKKTHKNHIDDYTTILPIYKTGLLLKDKKNHSYMDKAIRKASIVIQRHSIKIKRKEYCKWIDDSYLLVGKSYFYKGEFEEAIKTFSFIKNEYSKNEIRFNAALWLVRSYVEKQDFVAAEMELDELNNEKKFPEKLHKKLVTISADYYLQQKNYPLALEQLKKLEKLIKRKRKKARYNYIMAQIYQQHNNTKKAAEKFEKVVKSAAEYKMVFNAKMNLARSLDSESSDFEKMRQKLIKMTKDDKNKEYLDQIYYTLAKININEKDTLSAVNNYIESTTSSVQNDPQKAMSFLSLADIKYTQSKYKTAKIYYDSTIFYMDENFRLFNETKEKHEILSELVQYLNIVTLEDSLQRLAKLPTNQLNEVINQIIQNEIEQERERAEQERVKQQMMYENNRNGGRGEQFGNSTSGGNWYFYNPATLSFGLSEFRKKWGKRKLEDDWRRKNKKISTSFDSDSTLTDSTNNNITENKKTPNYYLKKLPKTDEDFEKSNTQIKEASYQAGTIYREYLNEYNKSTKMFRGIIFRFPKDKEYTPLAYYNIYKNQNYQENLLEAEKTKNILIKNHPKSIYAQILSNPNFKDKLITEENKIEKQYQSAYSDYTNKEYNKVISLTNNIKEDKYKQQYQFLRALSFGQNKDTVELRKGLTQIINKSLDTEIEKKAQEILEALKNPSKIAKANKLALTGESYIFKKEASHMSIIITPKEKVEINYLKTLISDYNSLNFENEVFEISAILIGLEKHLLIIKKFNNSLEALNYNELLLKDKKVIQELNKSDFRVMAISQENFKQFYKNKDIKGYYNFFQKKYLKKN